MEKIEEIDTALACVDHDWEPWKHRDADVDTGAEECRRCHQVKIVCRCGQRWTGVQMRASSEAQLLCADCWQREITRRLDALEDRLGVQP